MSVPGPTRVRISPTARAGLPADRSFVRAAVNCSSERAGIAAEIRAKAS